MKISFCSVWSKMKIWINRFRGIVKSNYNFTGSSLSLLKGKSGKGKSTIFEAIKWCFYGNMRGIYPFGSDSTAAKPTTVIIELDECDGLIIQRTQPPDVMCIKYKELNLVGKQAEAYLRDLFGSKSVWLSTSYVSQGEICPLLTMSNSDKMVLLRELIFGIEDNSIGTPEWCLNKVEIEHDEIISQLQYATVEYNLENKSLKLIEFPDDLETSEQDILKLYDLLIMQTESCKIKRRELLNSRKWEGKKETLLASIPVGSKRNIRNYPKEIGKITLELTNLKQIFEEEMQNETKKQYLLNSLPEKYDIIDIEPEKLPKLELNLEIEKNELIKIIRNESDRKSIISIIDQREIIEKDILILNEREKIVKLEISSLAIKIKKIEIEEHSLKRYLLENEEIDSELATLPNIDINQIEIDTEKELLNIDFWTKLSLHDKKKPTLPTIATKLTDERRIRLEDHLLRIKENNKICSQTQITIDKIPEAILYLEEILQAQIEIPKLENYQLISRNIAELVDKLGNNILTIEDINIKKHLLEVRIGTGLVCPSCHVNLELVEQSLKICDEKISPEVGLVEIERLVKIGEILTDLKNMREKLAELDIPTWKIGDHVKISKSEENNARQILEQLRQLPQLVEKLDENETISILKNDDILREYNLWLEQRTFFASENPYPPNSTKEELGRFLNNSYQQKARRNLLEQTKQKNLEKINIIPNNISSISLIEEKNRLEEEFMFIQENIELAKLYEKLSKIPNGSSIDKNKLIATLTEDILNLKEQIRIQKILTEIKKYSGVFNIDLSRLEIAKREEELSHLQEEYRIDKILQQLEVIPIFTTTEQSLYELEEQVQKTQDRYELCIKCHEQNEKKIQLELIQQKYFELTEKESALNRIKALINETINLTLQEKVDSINLSTNLILKELFEDDICIELKLTKELKTTKSIRSQINLVIRYKGFLYEGITHLSGGEKDRLSLALTLALACSSESRLLMFDECIASLDAEARELCTKVVRQFGTNKTVIFSCHEVVEGFFDQTITL